MPGRLGFVLDGLRQLKVFGGFLALTMRRISCAVLLCAMGAAQLCAAAKPGDDAGNGWRVVAHYKLEGTGSPGAAAIDAAARRLYVTRGNSIEVLDADSGVKAGEIACGSRVLGIAIAPKLKRGFASRADNSVTIFSTESMKVLKVVPSGGNEPDAVLFDDGSGQVYVANSASGSVTALDAASGKILATIDMGGRLRQMATSGFGRLYIAVEDKNAVHVVDTGTLKFLGDFPVDAGNKPYGLSLDPVGRRLFVACEDGALAVIDTDIGFTFEQLPIGSGASGSAFTFKPAAGWKGAAFIAAADGKLSFVRMDAFISYSSGGSLELQPGIHSVVFDPQKQHLLVPAAEEILVIGSGSCQECKQ